MRIAFRTIKFKKTNVNGDTETNFKFKYGGCKPEVVTYTRVHVSSVDATTMLQPCAINDKILITYFHDYTRSTLPLFLCILLPTINLPENLNCQVSLLGHLQE